MTMWYAGVGSRETPADVQELMTKIAMALEKGNYRLRSGGATGADSAFEAGIIDDVNKSIYLPYKGFNKNKSSKYDTPSEEALAWAKKAHPYFEKLGDFARSAHARNAHQVLGDKLNDPVKFVVCWTPDGAESTDECHSTDVTGGTRTAIVIATMNNIPVFNLARPDGLSRLRAFVRNEPVPARVEWTQDANYIKALIEYKKNKRKQKRTSGLSFSN